MRVAIACKKCEQGMGAMEAPTAAELRQMLKGTPFAAMAGLIPPNVATELATLPIFVCVTCTANNGEKPNGKQ